MKLAFTLVFLSLTCYLFSAPLITNITPNFGPDTGSVPVVISGSGFTGATSVTVDGVSTPFNPVNDTTITFTSAVHVPENVTVVVTTPAGSSPPNHPNDFYTFTGDWKAFIPVFNTGNVYWYNIKTGGNSANGQFITVGGQPRDVAIDPFGKYAYVVDDSKPGNLYVINIANLTQVTSGTLSLEAGPLAMAIHPTLPKAYITIDNTPSIAAVSVIDLTNPTAPTHTTDLVLSTNEQGEGVAFTPDGTLAFVGGVNGNNIYKLNALTDTLLTTTSFPASIGTTATPGWITMKPDQSFGLLTNTDLVQHAIWSMSTTPTFLSSVIDFNLVFFSQLVAARDNTFAYSADTNNGTISRYNVTTTTPMFPTSIAVGNNPQGIWISSDGTVGIATSSTTALFSRIDNINTTPTVTGVTLDTSNTLGTWPCITPDQAPWRGLRSQLHRAMSHCLMVRGRSRLSGQWPPGIGILAMEIKKRTPLLPQAIPMLLMVLSQ